MAVKLDDGGDAAKDGTDTKAEVQRRQAVSEEADHALKAVHARACAAAAAACTGELLTAMLFFPLELVKCRLQSSRRSEGCGFAYSGVADGLVSIVRQEGLRGLFIGIRPVVLRSIASELATVYFGEVLLGCYRSARGEGDSVAAVPLRTLGGWASIALTLPLETVATRVTCSEQPLSAISAAHTLWRESGVGAFWRGLNVSLLLCLNPALMVTTVDWLRATCFAILRLRGHLPSSGGQLSWGQAFLVGAIAKLVTMSVLYPLVRGKVLLQARDTRGVGIFGMLASMARNEGILCWYSGFGAQLSKSLMSASLKYAVKERTEKPFRQLFMPARC